MVAPGKVTEDHRRQLLVSSPRAQATTPRARVSACCPPGNTDSEGQKRKPVFSEHRGTLRATTGGGCHSPQTKTGPERPPRCPRAPRLTSPVRTLPRYFIFAAVTTLRMRERMVDTASSSSSTPFSVSQTQISLSEDELHSQNVDCVI